MTKKWQEPGILTRLPKRRITTRSGKAYRELEYIGGNPKWASSWEKGQTFPKNIIQRKYMKQSLRALDRGDIPLSTFNKIWDNIMGRLR